jgi:Tol biopolymer transport system component/DNA-binding winged helix-turn-helix (wHTH) protein
MEPTAMPDGMFQFGAFEVDEHSGELRKHGVRIRVQEQPFQILVLLLEHPGEIVGREEIRARLWPENTFVDFDSAISNAVRKLREALSDSADTPRFVETLARRGYRFIGPIETRSPAPLAVRKRTRIKIVPIAVGMLLLLGVASSWLWNRREPIASQLTPVPLTSASGWEMGPSFSPDGSQIAYAWDETSAGNHSHIYVKLVGSGRPVQLTAGPTSDLFPSWSPDGRSIAFLRMLDPGSADPSNAIYLISPVGGTQRKLTDGYFYGPGHWSPDGRFVAIAARKSPNGPPSLYRIGAENGEELRLTSPPNAQVTDAEPAFSPDGHTLVFVRCGATYTCGLYLLDLSSGYGHVGKPRLLRQESGAILGAAWTSDGRKIVYGLSTDAVLNFHLMRIRVGRAGVPERLSYTGDHVLRPAIAPHGNRLAYSQNFFDQDIWQVQPGKPPRSFASSTRLEYSAQYSPDGKHVAFSSDRSGQMEIWVSDAEGGNAQQLTNFEEHSGSPGWSPDGRWIAFDRHLKKGWHIFVMASDGGQLRQLTSDDGDEVIPKWSRDRNWIYYASDRTGRFEIWKAPAKGGKGIQVTRKGGWFASESHDGNFLYYTKNLDNNDDLSGLWELPLRGGEERLVLESLSSRSFDVTEDGIYYISPPAVDGTSSVQFHNFAGGPDQKIAPLKDYPWGLTVSPDRKTFLFSARSRAGSNVMVVENFK